MVKLYVVDKCLIETPQTVMMPRGRLQFGLALYLILERGRPVTRRHLMALFWPDRSEEEAQHPLREALRKLRRKGMPISADEETQRVVLPKGAAWVDVEELSAMDVDTLVSREYTILPGYEGGLSSAHKDWIDDTRTQLRTTAVAHLGRVLERTKVSADWGATLGIAEHILGLSPEHTRAREVAKHARKILQDRTGEALLGVSSDTPPRVLAIHDQPRQAGLGVLKQNYQASRDTTLVGRADDLSLLTTALQRAINGSGRGIYLHGAPGIGKSRLVRELVHIGETDGVAIRRTSCQPHDMHRPLSVFVDMVPSLRKLPGARGCYPHTHEYLDRLTRHDIGATTPKLDAHEVEYLYEHIRQALFDLVEAVADEQPLLFVIENVQWSDPHSWALLRDMAARFTSQAVLFVFTSREAWRDEVSGPCPDYIVNHHLSQLSAAATREHAQEYIAALGRSADAEFVERCVRVADGNPYFTEELVNNWVSTGERFGAPQSLHALMDKRLQGLDETALRVLQTCAVLGKNSTDERLWEVLEYPEYLFLSAIETLASAGMLTTAQDTQGDRINRVMCRHEVLAERALQSLSEQGLQRLHYKVGSVLEDALQNMDSASLLWDCAQHWHMAGNTTKAVKLGLACAAHLGDVGLTIDAIETCRKTLDFCSRPEERLSIITVYIKILHLTCEWTEVSRLFAEMHALREALGQDPDPHDDLELIQFNAEWNLSRNWDQVVEHSMRCVNSASASLHHRVEAGLVLLKMGTNMGETELMHKVYKLLSPAIATMGLEDIPLRLSFELVYHAICGDPDFCISVSQQLLQFIREHFRGAMLIRHMLTCATGFRRSGYKEWGDTLYAEAFDLATAEKAWALAGIAAHQLVLSELDDGKINGAKEWAARFEQLNRPTEELWGQRTFLISAIRIALESKNIKRAEQLFAMHPESFFKDSTIAARATFISTTVRLRILQDVDPIHIDELTNELYTVYVKLRGTGLQDFTVFSLYLGMTHSGRTEQGQKILHEYVDVFRRDRSPLLSEIRDVLQIA